MNQEMDESLQSLSRLALAASFELRKPNRDVYAVASCLERIARISNELTQTLDKALEQE